MNKIDTSPDGIRDLMSREVDETRWGQYTRTQKLLDCLKMLHAIAEEKEARGWKPIETAPKDGTWILSYCGINKHCVVLRWDDEYECFEDSTMCAYHVTHWMPMLEGPTS